MKDYIYRRLRRSSDRVRKNDPNITAEDREAILAILRETKPGLPDYWNALDSVSRSIEACVKGGFLQVELV